MMHRLCLLLLVSVVCSFPAGWLNGDENTEKSLDDNLLRVMVWNIWHGGREDGDVEGPKRVVDVIRESKADIVAMQETYGSGELISQELGFHFLLRGTNVSIHSRFPIVEDISVHEEFKCVGALIELPGNHRIAMYSIWLPYGKDIWIPKIRQASSPAELLEACQPSAIDLQAIYAAIEKRLDAPKYNNVAIIIAGDFNSMSHLDWNAVAKDQFGQVVDWNTSHVLIDAGFRDSYRECRPTVNRLHDATWSPRFSEQEQERIDFIYYRSNRLQATSSRTIREHTEKFPSDHAAVLSEFLIADEPMSSAAEAPQTVTAVTYNIKRGLGNDGVADLHRTTDVLRALDADLIALQEVDWNARRSGIVNQASVLGESLGMHAAFGPFMDFQGGQYGMAILSRYPICSVEPVELPEGNEPRVALVVEVQLPNTRRLKIISVHFDWVRDDSYRYAQAQVLADYIKTLTVPFVLMGDFNDTPESRTLDLFREVADEMRKPAERAATIPAEKPAAEIDYIFVGPASSWKLGSAEVIEEKMASDHRPVMAELQLRKLP